MQEMLCVFLEVGAKILVGPITWIIFGSRGDRWKTTLLKNLFRGRNSNPSGRIPKIFIIINT
jgi:hypothetical protein